MAMAVLWMVLTAVLAVFPPLSWAQQFTGTQMFTNYTGLSTSCQDALATNVTCSPYLGVVSESNGVMTADQVDAVCVDGCYASLKAARTVIAAACTLSTDAIMVENVPYPATFIVDNYLFTYQRSCRTDSTTGAYCDPLNLSASWSIPTATSNPGYVYKPTYLPTAPNTLTDCKSYVNYYDNSTYNVNSCRFIAYAYDVRFDNFLAWNPSLDSNMTTCTLQPGYSYCAVLDDSYLIGDSDSDGGSFCLPIKVIEPTTVSNCNCFTQVNGYLKGDYQCEDIEDDFSITEAELVAWNPWLAGDCDTALYANLIDNDSRAVCIGVGSITSTTTASATTTTSAAPTQTGAIAGCQEFFTVQSGDDCSTIEAKFGVTFAQLYEWNPAIGSDCQTLGIGYAVCVGVSS